MNNVEQPAIEDDDAVAAARFSRERSELPALSLSLLSVITRRLIKTAIFLPGALQTPR